MKIKKRKEMRKRSYTQESKTELFFRFFGQDNFFIFAEKCSSFSSSCKRDGKLADGNIEQIEVCMKKERKRRKKRS